MVSKITDDNFENEIAASEKPVLVDFFAEWCEPCSVLGPILEIAASEMGGKIVLIKANIDDIPRTAQKFGIDRIPTVVLFDRGKPVGGFVGLLRKEAIKDLLENALEKLEENPNIEKMTEYYQKYANENGIKLNPDQKTVERIMNGLLANEKKYGKRYCPCRRVTGDTYEDSKKICPCAYHKAEIEKDGKCFCGLFVR